MQLKILLLISFSILTNFGAFAQSTGIIRGKVTEKSTGQALSGATIVVENTSLGALSDQNGDFKIDKINAGSYNISASFFGYLTITRYNVIVTSGNDQILSFELEEETRKIDEIVLKRDKSASASPADIVTPLSTQRLTSEEIKSNPGGNFDISRVVQALPGVAGSSTGFRNDIIIRGGSPNENVYYLDGIEIPVINHFSTQGSAGGPQGMINVSFIDDLKLSSSAFYSGYENALSSTFEFRQREGNPERLSGNVRFSASEVAGTFEGPIAKKTNYIVSARRSYLQYLFKALDVPIRPNYWDFQFRTTTRLNSKTTIKAIGIGAIDEFTFSAPRKPNPDKEYALRSSPLINQWNYTTGVVVNRTIGSGSLNFYLSRNMFNNAVDKFDDKQYGVESKRALKLRSQEIENKLRVELKQNIRGIKFSGGVSLQYVKFNNEIFSRIRKAITDDKGNLIQPGVQINYNTAIDFFRYGFFAQASRSFLDGRAGVSAGIRSDMNSFTNEGSNPLKSLSPRLSIFYDLTEKWKISASIGSYYKLPAYTILGFQNNTGAFVNKNVSYINSVHYVAGLEFLPRKDLRFTAEAFYKNYNRYPVSVRDGISLANLGAEFGAVGNEAVVSTGDGKTYGFEIYGQQKLTKNYYAIVSYTFVRSLFSGNNGVLIPSAWDSRHLLSLIAGRKFKKGWEAGIKYRFSGGVPYTPFDTAASRLNYASAGTGILDLNNLNTKRLKSFNQIDIRIDKKWNFRKWTLDVFVDVQNIFKFPTPGYPQYSFKRTDDNTDFATTDGSPLRTDGSNGIPVILNNNDPVFLPTFGFIIEF